MCVYLVGSHMNLYYYKPRRKSREHHLPLSPACVNQAGMHVAFLTRHFYPIGPAMIRGRVLPRLWWNPIGCETRWSTWRYLEFPKFPSSEERSCARAKQNKSKALWSGKRRATQVWARGVNKRLVRVCGDGAELVSGAACLAAGPEWERGRVGVGNSANHPLFTIMSEPWIWLLQQPQPPSIYLL